MIRGFIFPTWNKQFFSLSALHEHLFHGNTKDKLLPMMSLKGSFVKKDTNAKSGKSFCFLIQSEADKRTYYLAAESEEEMDQWVQVIQQRIDAINYS
jgi:hypothetical protein